MIVTCDWEGCGKEPGEGVLQTFAINGRQFDVCLEHLKLQIPGRYTHEELQAQAVDLQLQLSQLQFKPGQR